MRAEATPTVQWEGQALGTGGHVLQTEEKHRASSGWTDTATAAPLAPLPTSLPSPQDHLGIHRCEGRVLHAGLPVMPRVELNGHLTCSLLSSGKYFCTRSMTTFLRFLLGLAAEFYYMPSNHLLI